MCLRRYDKVCENCIAKILYRGRRSVLLLLGLRGT